MANTLNKVNRGDFDRLLMGWLAREMRAESGAAVTREEVEKAWEDIMGGITALPKEFVVEINQRIRSEGGSMADVIDYREAQGRLGKQELYNWYNEPGDWDMERIRAEGRVGSPPGQVTGRHGSFPLLNKVRNPSLGQEDQRRRLHHSFDTRIRTDMPGQGALAQSKVDQAMARSGGMRNESGAAVRRDPRQGGHTGWGQTEEDLMNLRRRFQDQIRTLGSRFGIGG